MADVDGIRSPGDSDLPKPVAGKEKAAGPDLVQVGQAGRGFNTGEDPSRPFTTPDKNDPASGFNVGAEIVQIRKPEKLSSELTPEQEDALKEEFKILGAAYDLETVAANAAEKLTGWPEGATQEQYNSMVDHMIEGLRRGSARAELEECKRLAADRASKEIMPE